MHYYTPIIISKSGEFTALSKLEHLDKTQVIPLVQFVEDTKPDRVRNYVDQRIAPLIKNWNFLDNRIYLDVSLLGDNIELAKEIFEKLSLVRVNIIPVITHDTSAEFLKLFKSYTYYGICLRFKGDHIDGEIVESLIGSITKIFSVAISEIDLVIDFGFVSKDSVKSCANSFDYIYSKMTQGKNSRKIIVGAGSFPSDLGNFTKDTVTSIPRYEWDLWKQAKALSITTPLIYGDYGNVNPVYNQEFAKYSGTCSIRYTTENDFYIFKGEKGDRHPLGNEQYIFKSEDLIHRSFYEGSLFSWGDGEIYKRGIRRSSPGGPPTWVKITQNHHFVKILNLLRPKSESASNRLFF